MSLHSFWAAECVTITPLMHFFLVAKIGREYCPLVVVAQSPPDDGQWMALRKEFVLDRIKGVYEWLTSTKRHCGLVAELEAATDVYGGGRDNVPGAGGNVRASPLLTIEQKKALKRDPHPARFPYLAHSFLQIIKDRPVRSLNLQREATMHWGLAQLGTTFKYEDMRNQAVIFDITDLDNISMGVLRGERAGGREMCFVEDWAGKDRVAQFDDNFPQLPLMDQSVQKSKFLSLSCPPSFASTPSNCAKLFV